MRKLMISGLAAGLLVLVVCLGCSCEMEEEGFVVMSWNLQNLMDGEVQGTEYEEFLEEGVWDEQDYRQRLGTICGAIARFEPEPDLIVFQEVENEGVLRDMVEMRLGKLGFGWYGATDGAGAAIQVGFVSKVPLGVEDIVVWGVEGQRPVMQLHLEVEGEDLVVLALHGKSKSEGDEATEGRRIEMVRVLKEAVGMARSRWPGALVLMAGDFNEVPGNTESMWQRALIEADGPGLDTRVAAGWEKLGSLMVCGDGAECVANSVSSAAGVANSAAGWWYSFWLDEEVQKEREGSYFYHEVWEGIDQVLCSGEGFDGAGLEVAGAGVLAPWFLCDGSGAPNRFNLYSKAGVSDHLPVWLEIRGLSGTRGGL